MLLLFINVAGGTLLASIKTCSDAWEQKKKENLNVKLTFDYFNALLQQQGYIALCTASHPFFFLD